MASDPAHVFAKFDGVLATSNQVGQFNISIRPADFVLASNHIILGLQLRRPDGSTLDPAAAQVTAKGSAAVGTVFAAADLANRTQSLALVDLVAGDYRIDVRSDRGTSGAFALDVFLVGDSDGNRAVTLADGQAITSTLGAVAGDARYRVEADANLDGLISSYDYSQWRKNLTVQTTVNPLAVGLTVTPNPAVLPDGTLVVDQANVALSGTTNPGATVKLDTDGNSDFGEGTTTADVGGHYIFNVTLNAGSNTLQVQASDGFGQRRTSSVQITLRTSGDTDPPVIAAGLVNDTGQSNTDGLTSDPAIAGTVTDASTIASFRAGFDAAPSASYANVLGTLGQGGRFSFDLARLVQINQGPLSDGPHTLHLQAADDHGNTSGLFNIAFTLDTQTPVVRILAPTSGVITNRNVTVSGNVTDTTTRATSLQGRLDAGTFFNVPFNPATGAFAFDTTLALNGTADGTHTVHLQGTDAAGNVSNFFDVSLNLDTTPPTAPVFDLSASSDTDVPGDHTTSAARVVLIGRTDPNTPVTLLPTGAVTLSDNSGDFQFPDVDLAFGGNTFTVRAVDPVSNASTFTRTIQRINATTTGDVVLDWNRTLLDAVRLDATPPPLASRNMAMTQAAVYDAISAVDGTPGFYVRRSAPAGTSPVAAAAAAAHRVLTYLYPAQAATFDAALAASLASVPNGPGKTAGVALGHSVADAIIALRSTDGWDKFVNYVPGSQPGDWQPTGPSYASALLPQWADLQPFAMSNPAQFLPPGPPDLASQAWAAAYNEVKSLGSATGSTRTADQTQIARFWADGAGTVTPPGHWNEIATQIAQAQGNSLAANARLLAELNIALADAAIVCWNAKYDYEMWRPITAIRGGETDGNPNTAPDANWTPLLVTPNFPEYVSGHSTFSAAAATILTDFFGGNVGFTIGSPSLPGVQRKFISFQAAAEEAGLSRIYGGIHYAFSNQDGLAAGRSLGAYVLSTFAVSTDTQAPKVFVSSPQPALVTSQNTTLTGQVLDNLSGVQNLEVQLDGSGFTPVSFDADGHFTLTTTFALNGSADGGHTFRFRATDYSGNTSNPLAFAITLDTRTPALTVTAPTGGSTLTAASRLTGTVSGTGSAISRLSYTFDAGQEYPIFLADTLDAPLDLSRLATGNHTLTVTAVDAAGNTTTRTVSVSLPAAIPLQITEITPANGADDVGSTFRPKVTFSRAINAATLNAANFYATDTTGAKLAANIVVANDGTFAWLFFQNPMPGASTITVTVDGTTIRAADGTALDADGDGNPGGSFRSQFSTVSLAILPNTSLSGLVADPGPDLHPMTFDDVRVGPDGVLVTADDLYLNPIAHAKVYILGLESQFVYTDAQGRFSFASVPSGDIKLAIDGRTATNAPAGIYFPEMVMDLTVDPGRANTVMGSMGTREERAAMDAVPGVYLPRVLTSILQSVNNAAVTTIGVAAAAAPDLTPEQRSMLTIAVQPGSLIGPDGQRLASGQVGISTVPPELVRDMLPPGLLQHTFDITVQAPGISNFSTPAPLTFPNVFHAAPGTKLNFLSFDHTTGRLVIEGTATVSADGLSATTDPGTGITHPGWHGLTPPGTTDNTSGGSGGAGGNGGGGGCPPNENMPPPPTPVNVTIGPDVSVKEGDSGYTDMIFYVTGGMAPTGCNPQGVVGRDVLVKTVPGTAQDGVDYFGIPPTVVHVEPGQTIPLFVKVIGDKIVEGDETFVVQLIDIETGATMGQAQGTILDDDPVGSNDQIPHISISDQSVVEGDSGTTTAVFTISLDHAYEFGVDAAVLTVDGTAKQGEDYIFNSENIHFGPNERVKQFEVQIIGDTVKELTEAFTVEFIPGAVTNAEIAKGVGVGTIRDNDPGKLYQVGVSINGVAIFDAVDSFVIQDPLQRPLVNHQVHLGPVNYDVNYNAQGTISSPYLPTFDLDINGAGGTVDLGVGVDIRFGVDGKIGSDVLNIHPGTYNLGLSGSFSVVIPPAYAFICNGLLLFDNLLCLGAVAPLPFKSIASGIPSQIVHGKPTDIEVDFSYIRTAFFSTTATIKNLNIHVFSRELTDSSSPSIEAAPTPFLGPVSQSNGFGADSRTYYRYILPGGTEIGGRSTPVGDFSAVLPPDSNYNLIVYQPSTNRSEVYSGHTGPSGSASTRTLMFSQFGGPDEDGDGIPDIGEFAIGTSLGNEDTDGDGIDDASELAQGLDPLGGRAFPTGLIASLPLQGEAKEVVAEGSTLNAQSQTAYVATGSYGLAIVDASRFQRPIVAGQIDLAGDATDVAVDSRLQIAVVAGNAGGLHFVDVSDPTTPTLIRTINVAASQVEIIDGLAYVAAGNSLLVYDVFTGEKLQTLGLGGATLTGLARESSMLYTIDSSRVLRAIDIGGFEMVARGSLTLPAAGGKLFVGNGIAYVGAGGGFVTANVANPNNLQLLSGVDAANIVGSAVVANGSGLAVAVGSLRGPTGQQFNALDVLNVADPTNTGAFLTRIDLPVAPNSVTVAGGIAFIADGTGGLQVVNYLPFDNKRQAPTVTISAPGADLDPNTPGIQVLAGTSVAVAANISDDVQVRNVELLVNGTVVRNDVSFPFDLTAIALANSSTDPTATIQVRATDTGGNITLSAPLVLQIVPDTFAPTIVSANFGDGEKVLQNFRNLQFNFSKPLAAATVASETFQLTDSTGHILPPADLQLRFSDRQVRITYATLDPGDYTFVIDTSAVTDRAGNPIGGANYVRHFTVTPGTTKWVNPSSGFWDDPANWLNGVLPGPTDYAVIDVPGNATITYRTGSTVIAGLLSSEAITLSGGTLNVTNSAQFDGGLTLSGGTLTGSGDLTVAGVMTWTAGTLAGTGRLVLSAGAALNIQGNVTAAGRPIDSTAGAVNWTTGTIGGTLVNAGVLNIGGAATKTVGGVVNETGATTWTGAGNINFNDGTTFNSLAGSVFDVQTDARMGRPGGGALPTFSNAGTLRKSAGVATPVDVAFTNSGTVDLQVGDVTLNAGATMAAGSAVVGPGRLRIPAATVTVNAGMSAANLVLEGGTLTGSGDLTVAGVMTWTAGTLAGTGRLVLSAGAALNIQGNVTAAGRPIDSTAGAVNWTTGTIGGTLVNAGVLNIGGAATKTVGGVVNETGATTWTGAGNINFNDGTTFNSLAGSVFDIQTDARMGRPGGGALPVFANAGTLKKSTGTATPIDVALSNSGTVDVESGSLTLNAGATMAAGSAIVGPGQVRIPAATVTVNAAMSASNLVLEGGTLTGAGDLTVTGQLLWTAGTLAGAGRVVLAAGAGLNIQGNVTAAARPIDSTAGAVNWTTGTIGGTMVNAGVLNIGGVATKTVGGVVNQTGTTTWTGAGNINFNDGTAFNSLAGSVFDIQTDARMGRPGGGALPVFANAGTLRKSAGVATPVDISLSNSGTIDLQVGDLTLNAGATMAAGSAVAGPGRLRVPGSTVTVNAAMSASNLVLEGGTLTGAGDLTVTGVMTWTAGTLAGTGKLMLGAGAALNIQGNVTSGGRPIDSAAGAVNWTTGTIGGTLVNTGVLNIGGAATKTVGGVINQAGVTTWTGAGNINFNDGTTFNSLAGSVFDVQTDARMGRPGGGALPVFGNVGTLRKSASVATPVDVALANSGTIDLQVGDLTLNAGATMAAGSAIVGPGRLRIPGSTVTVNAAMSASNLVLEGGTLTGAGDLTVTGQLLWTAGTLAGTGKLMLGTGAALNIQGNVTAAGRPIDSTAGAVNWTTGTIGGTLVNAGVLNIAGAATKTVGGVVNQTGATTWAGAGNINFNDGTSFNSLAGSVFDVQTDARMGRPGGGALPVFANAGTFKKSAGTTTPVDIAFTNSGTVGLQVGTVNFGAGFTQTVGSTILSGGTLSGSLIDLQGGSLSGGGSVNASVRNAGQINPGGSGAGRLAISGNYTQLASGILNFDLGGLTAGSQFDQLVVTGSVTLDGTLNVSLINGFTPANNDAFAVLTFGSRSGDFATKNGLDLGGGMILIPTFGASAMTLTASSGSPQRASGPANRATTGSGVLTVATLQPLVDAAINRWTTALGDGSRTGALKHVSFRIADLPGTYLGWTSVSVVWIDRDAAEYGWFIDASPLDDSEFGDARARSEFHAGGTSPALGRMDLLTVIAHELGHVLGLDDLDPTVAPDDLMAETLAPGIRRLPGPPISIPHTGRRNTLDGLPSPAVAGLGEVASSGIRPGNTDRQTTDKQTARPVLDIASLDRIIAAPEMWHDLFGDITPHFGVLRGGKRPDQRRTS